MDIRDGVSQNTSFFLTNKEAVDSEMEEKESKDKESHEETTDKSQKPNSSRYEKNNNTRWSNNYSWLKQDSGEASHEQNNKCHFLIQKKLH